MGFGCFIYMTTAFLELENAINLETGFKVFEINTIIITVESTKMVTPYTYILNVQSIALVFKLSMKYPQHCTFCMSPYI